MFYSSGRPGLSSFGVGIAAYLIGAAFAAAVTTHAVWRVSAVVLEQLAPATDTPRSHEVATAAPVMRAGMSVPAAGSQSIRREGAMTPLADRWDGRWGGPYARPQPRVWGAAAPQFGTSARNPYRSYGDDRPYDPDDDDHRAYGTYRSVCVRL